MSPDPVPPAAQHAEVFGRNKVVVQIQGDGNTAIPVRVLTARGGGKTRLALELCDEASPSPLRSEQ